MASKEIWLEFHKRNGIAVTAYSALGGPSFGPERETPVKSAVVEEIAKAHGKTPAQVVLRWAIQRGTAIIPKSVNDDRQK